jgi:hypothetical protein
MRIENIHYRKYYGAGGRCSAMAGTPDFYFQAAQI